MDIKDNSCKHCDFLQKTFCNTNDTIEREYWLMTEVFVYLHQGKDYCSIAQNNSQNGFFNIKNRSPKNNDRGDYIIVAFSEIGTRYIAMAYWDGFKFQDGKGKDIPTVTHWKYLPELPLDDRFQDDELN